MFEQVKEANRVYLNMIGRWGDGLASETEMESAKADYARICLAFQVQAPLRISGHAGPIRSEQDQQLIEKVLRTFKIDNYQLNTDDGVYYVECTSEQMVELILWCEECAPGALSFDMVPVEERG